VREWWGRGVKVLLGGGLSFKYYRKWELMHYNSADFPLASSQSEGSTATGTIIASFCNILHQGSHRQRRY
jgi:hypothetical protein